MGRRMNEKDLKECVVRPLTKDSALLETLCYFAALATYMQQKKAK